MRKVKFTFCTEDVVVQEHSASIEVPDNETEVEVYIEENKDKWKYEEWEGIVKTRSVGDPMEIEVQDD